MQNQPFITIVVPVRNEVNFIRETLMQLIGQDYPAYCFEIIVADGMSDDGTRVIVSELARGCPRIRLLDNPKRLSSTGRNIGFKNGRGDIFLVLDGHCFIPDGQLLNNVAGCFAVSGADCLGRPQPLDPPGLTPFQGAVALARASGLGHGGDSLIYSDYEGYASPVSNGAVYRREVFDRIGYVDEEFDACEDLEFNYRLEKAGLKAYMSPALTVRYYPRDRLERLFRQMARYGRGRFRFIKKHPDALTLNQLLPALFVGGGCCMAGVGIMHLFNGGLPFMTGLLLAVYGFYSLLVLFETVRISLRHGWRYLPLLPVVFFTVHAGLGYGFLVEALKSRRT